MKAVCRLTPVAILLAGLLLHQSARASSHDDAKIALEAWLELFVAGQEQKLIELSTTNETLVYFESDGTIKWAEAIPSMRKVVGEAFPNGLKGYELAERVVYGTRLARLRYFMVGQQAHEIALWTFALQNNGSVWVLANIQFDSGKGMYQRLRLKD